MLSALPPVMVLNILYRILFGMHVRIGVKVVRTTPEYTTTDFLIPNTHKTWWEYIHSQPEFRDNTFYTDDQHFQWARDSLATGELKIMYNVLYIDVFDLFRLPTSELILAKKVFNLNMGLGIFPEVIFNV